MTDLSEFFSNVDAATQPRGRGKLMKPPVDANQNARDALYGAGNFISPAATSLATGEPPAPIQELPGTPQKVPGTDDRRYMDAAAEIAPWAIGAGPMGGARAGVSAAGNMAARFGPRAVRFAPAAEAAPGGMARDVAAGAAAGAFAPSEANAQAPQGQDIRALQTELKRSGDYTGAIDGKWGEATQAAVNAARIKKEQREAEDRQLERDKVTASLGVSKATQAAEAAKTEETKRLSRETELRNQQREAGNKRLQEVETNLSPTSKAIRSYSGPAGYGVGLGMGMLARGGAVKMADKLSANKARKAEELFMKDGTEVAMKGAPDRVARSNEFARKGGGVEPFEVTPKVNPGYRANDSATPFNELYQPSKGKNLATDLGIAGAFGGEAALGEFKLKPDAHEELIAATQAANADPSEINIGRLQDAKDNVALWEGASNIGRGGAVGYGLRAMKTQRAPSAPNMAPAEAEKMSLEATLRKLAPKTKKGLAPAAPAPSAPNPNSPMPPSAPSSGTQFMGMPLRK